MAAEVLNSSSVLRLNICAKLNICASISATSPSRKPLAVILRQTLLYGQNKNIDSTIREQKRGQKL